MPFDGTAEVWVATADLPVSRPFAITSSPDGQTIYVGCVGSGSNGVVVAIDLLTKAQTTLVSGLDYVKHGMFCDADGHLYFATGSNNSNTATSTLHKWDITTETASTVWTEAGGLYGFCLGGADEVYLQHRGGTYDEKARKRRLDGTIDWTSTWSELGGQIRGMGVTSDRVLACDSDNARIVQFSRSTGAFVLEDTVWTGEPHGISVISDTEAYVLTTDASLYQYDPYTQAKTRLDNGISLPDTTASDTGFNNVHVTSEGIGFVVRGGWVADPANAEPEDIAMSTDTGIFICDSIPSSRRPVVGRIGWR